MKIWVLTREINEYDQDGEYYVKAFGEKPSKEQLMAHGVREEAIEHTLNGGGRASLKENEWFHLREVEPE